MERIIIDNQTDQPTNEVLPYVAQVIHMGKISGTMGKKVSSAMTSYGLPTYCYVTSWTDIVVIAVANKKSYRFVVRANQALHTDRSTGPAKE